MCPSFGAGEVIILKSFYLPILTSFLTSLLKVKEVCPFQTEVVTMRPPHGTLGRHSNQVQRNFLSHARLATSDSTVMTSKNLSHYRRHCHLESCGRQSLLLMPHGPVGSTLCVTFAWPSPAVSLCKFSMSFSSFKLCAS